MSPNVSFLSTLSMSMMTHEVNSQQVLIHLSNLILAFHVFSLFIAVWRSPFREFLQNLEAKLQQQSKINNNPQSFHKNYCINILTLMIYCSIMSCLTMSEAGLMTMLTGDRTYLYCCLFLYNTVLYETLYSTVHKRTLMTSLKGSACLWYLHYS